MAWTSLQAKWCILGGNRCSELCAAFRSSFARLATALKFRTFFLHDVLCFGMPQYPCLCSDPRPPKTFLICFDPLACASDYSPRMPPHTLTEKNAATRAHMQYPSMFGKSPRWKNTWESYPCGPTPNRGSYPCGKTSQRVTHLDRHSNMLAACRVDCLH